MWRLSPPAASSSGATGGTATARFSRTPCSLGLDPARITIVGDDPADLEAALREGLAADLCVVSGGLGPTHDDRTVEMVARSAGVGLAVDEDLEGQIEAVSRSYAERLGRPYADFAHGVRKQATLPEGAISIGLAGTAPGFVLQSGGAAVVVLPGPPGELQRLWPGALETEPVQAVVARARPRGRHAAALRRQRVDRRADAVRGRR